MPATELHPAERNLITRALRALADNERKLLDTHRTHARILADRIDEADGVMLTAAEDIPADPSV